jgi:hypothetical protein
VKRGLDNETCLGLAEADFKADHLPQYLGSAADITTNTIKTADVQPSNNLLITTYSLFYTFPQKLVQAELCEYELGNGNVGLANILKSTRQSK